MQQKVAASSKTIIFTAHNEEVLDENAGAMVQKVPIKGALKGNGLESYFSTVIYTRKVPITKLKGYENPLLNITEEEEMLGFKYVYQTKLTKDMVNSRIRGPMGLWSNNETFIDNNIQIVMDRLNEYYGEDE